jgi:hypothetical protein
VIQELGTVTAKKVSLSVKGIDSSLIGKPKDFDLINEISGVLSLGCFSVPYLPVVLPPSGTYIITQQNYTKNPIDGSFSIDMAYICNTSGCYT